MSFPISPVLHFRSLLASKLAQISTELTLEQISLIIETANKPGKSHFFIPLPKLQRFKVKPDELASKWTQELKSDKLLECYLEETGDKKKMSILNFAINKVELVKATLKQVFSLKEKYGQNDSMKGQKIAIDYSSPNIAKPFHAGHLRSTIIGGFLRNLFTTCGAQVIGINYLGDWGKQYGVLAVGYEKYGNEQTLESDPIKHLFDVYVKINEDIDKDKSIDEKAREYFKRMEEGDPQCIALWKKFRDLSLRDYQKTYDRLGVHFDVFAGESEMSEKMEPQIKILKEKNLLTENKGAFVVDLSKSGLGIALIKKSDGATLYLTRDIAAAVHRYDQYKFDKMFYVVAAQQDLHFKQLFKVLDMMGYPWAKNCHHINFGMVRGLNEEGEASTISSRRGNVIFLDEILMKAKKHMFDKMSLDTKHKLKEIADHERTADQIGLSAVYIQDFSAKRVKDYTFSWDRMTSFEGHTGPYLQYAHARLCSMEDKNKEIPITDDVNFELLQEKEAVEMAFAIAKFPDVVLQCAKDNSLEPSTLVSYLFELSHQISVAHSALWVKGQESEIAKARALLYWAARITLGNGLKVLGVHPVERM
eukprot:TRINITY_DN7002_c0_g1_i1.p1 TRINITY_DN7002_c0_g1~~TRINITY_DN7002_c0_g1_i1.p1  ORF type:complete len:591 (-),score=123.04 TRINITY_DN7002_c0_g1_i1:67-1839(-)